MSVVTNCGNREEVFLIKYDSKFREYDSNCPEAAQLVSAHHDSLQVFLGIRKRGMPTRDLSFEVRK